MRRAGWIRGSWPSTEKEDGKVSPTRRKDCGGEGRYRGLGMGMGMGS